VDLSLPLAFTVGLFSALHCIGMCGGIMGALSFGLGQGVRRRPFATFLFVLAYNGGRIASYTVAGALVGALGEGILARLAPGQGLQWLQWLAALILVVVGLHLAGWLPGMARIERLGAPVWRRLEPLGRRLLPVETLPRAFAYGAVWGWLPCGLVYVMLIGAATRADWAGGAAYMLAFGVGTLPAVVGTGLMAGRLFQLGRSQRLRRVVGAGILLLGLASLVFPGLLGVDAPASPEGPHEPRVSVNADPYSKGWC
jgi:sulfite exporter TauE/SafE